MTDTTHDKDKALDLALKHARPHHVIVAGFGPVGRAVVTQLEASGANVTLIELNPDTVYTQTRLNRTAILGDATEPAVLKEAGIDSADALVLSMPDETAALAACHAARKLSPTIFIAARTNFFSRGLLATKAGADHVVVEELVTALAMRDAVMQQLQPPE
jgi:monovalent cation:H+ antiporter-2, CPA2 family